MTGSGQAETVREFDATGPRGSSTPATRGSSTRRRRLVVLRRCRHPVVLHLRQRRDMGAGEMDDVVSSWFPSDKSDKRGLLIPCRWPRRSLRRRMLRTFCTNPARWEFFQHASVDDLRDRRPAPRQRSDGGSSSPGAPIRTAPAKRQRSPGSRSASECLEQLILAAEVPEKASSEPGIACSEEHRHHRRSRIKEPVRHRPRRLPGPGPNPSTGPSPSPGPSPEAETGRGLVGLVVALEVHLGAHDHDDHHRGTLEASPAPGRYFATPRVVVDSQ